MLIFDTKPCPTRKKKRFYFDKRWLQREEINDIIKQAWDQDDEGTRMFRVISKVKRCRVTLLQWKNKIQGNARENIEALKCQLQELKTRDFEGKRDVRNGLKKSLKEAYRNEEMYWSQNARVQWLKIGDKNTSFFHATVEGRRKRNRMLEIQRENGTWTKGEKELGAEVVDYYKHLFSTSETREMEEVLDGIPHTISDSMNENLTKPVGEEEIRLALFSMYPDKAPGIDGMPPLFFQKFWHIVKKDIVGAIQTFFHTGHLTKSVNHTIISLIPKVKIPTSLTHYRPISLRSTVYKIIAKILAC